MKNSKILSFLYVFLVVAFLSSCTKNEDTSIDTSSINQKKIENILTEMKSLGDSQGEIIVFEFKNISEKDYKNHFKVIKNSKKVLAFALGSGSTLERQEDNYTVTCTWGNGETEVTECGNNVGCAGQATWDCLENGGCATVCNGRITYTPSNIKLNQKAQKKKQLSSILDEVKKIGDAKKKAISFSIAFNNDKYWLKEFSTIKHNTHKLVENTYQVDCYDSSGEILWMETYPDKLSAAQGILDCTDNWGGCAEICEIYARYIPKR